MAAPRASTLLETMGFRDPELHQPSHDALCRWAKRNAMLIAEQIYPDDFRPYILSTTNLDQYREDILKRIESLSPVEAFQTEEQIRARYKAFPDQNKWVQEQLQSQERLRQRREITLANLKSAPPEAKPTLQENKLEHSIKDGNRAPRIVGFADLWISYSYPTNTEFVMENDGPGYWSTTHRDRRILVEVKCRIDSLGALLRQMSTYGTYTRAAQAVVSPDTRFAEDIRAEGIAFIEAPKDFVVVPPQGELLL